MKKGVIFFLCCTLVLVFTLTACAPKGPDTSGPAQTPSSGSDKTGGQSSGGDTDTPKEVSLEGVELSYWVPFGGTSRQEIQDFSQNLAYMEKEKQTGVKVEWIHPPEGQENETFAIMIASDDLPDLIQQAEKYKGGIDRAIQDGIYLNINELCEQYAPNFMKVINSDPELRKEMYSDSGNLLGFGMICSDMPGDDWTVTRENPWCGPFIRGDWLEELGLDVPETIDDWTEALTAMKEKYNPEVVMAIEKTGIQNSTGVFVSAFGIGPEFYQKDGKVLWGPGQPEFKGYLQLMHDWYAAGLIDPDFPTRDGKETEAQYMRGQLAAKMQDGTALPLKVEPEGIKFVGTPYPKLSDSSDDIHWTYRNNMCRGEWTVITKDCKNPEAAVKWMDWNYTEEGANIINFGPKGVTYEVKNDLGMPQYLEEFAPPHWDVRNQVFRLHNGPYLKSDYRSNPRRAMAHLEAFRVVWDEQQKNNDDYHLPPITLTAEEGAESATIMSDANTYRDEMIVKFITGTEPLDNFDQYLETVNGFGIQRACELREIALERYNNR
jgi:putative aldouronate transport system substrate-binding protein